MFFCSRFQRFRYWLQRGWRQTTSLAFGTRNEQRMERISTRQRTRQSRVLRTIVPSRIPTPQIGATASVFYILLVQTSHMVPGGHGNQRKRQPDATHGEYLLLHRRWQDSAPPRWQTAPVESPLSLLEDPRVLQEPVRAHCGQQRGAPRVPPGANGGRGEQRGSRSVALVVEFGDIQGVAGGGRVVQRVTTTWPYHVIQDVVFVGVVDIIGF